jgi:SpoU rRNA methylase family enzyme
LYEILSSKRPYTYFSQRKELDLILGGGNVVYCRTDQTCSPATSNSLPFANGLVRGHDGLIYVPFSAATYIGVYRISSAGSLEEVTRIPVGMGLDNLSVDSSGNIWAAGVPRVLELIGAVGEPFDKTSPSTIFRIRKTGERQYEVDKVLEDGEAKLVSGATTAVFDGQSERLFIGGAATPFLIDCKSQQS